MPSIERALSFDAGIEQILIQNDPRPATLPDSVRSVPGEGQITRLLDQVLRPASVEETLVESLRPEISHRELLSPPGYEAAREATAVALQQVLPQLPDSRDRTAIENALQLLSDDKSLRDLLNTYRNLLHRA